MENYLPYNRVNHYATKIIDEPSVEPVSVAEVKEQLGQTLSDDDVKIGRLIGVARRSWEKRTGQRLITQTIEMALDCFDQWEILFPVFPIQSITSLKYIDNGGTEQTQDSSKYLLDNYSKPSRVTPAYNCYWPYPRFQNNAVKIRFVAGYGVDSTAVPEDPRHGIILLATHLYSQRDIVSEDNLTCVPEAFDALVEQNKLRSF